MELLSERKESKQDFMVFWESLYRENQKFCKSQRTMKRESTFFIPGSTDSTPILETKFWKPWKFYGNVLWDICMLISIYFYKHYAERAAIEWIYAFTAYRPVTKQFPWSGQDISYYHVFTTEDMVDLQKLCADFMPLGSLGHIHRSLQQFQERGNCVNEVRASMQYEDRTWRTLTRDKILFVFKRDCLKNLRDNLSFKKSRSMRSSFHITVTEFGFHAWQRGFPSKNKVQAVYYLLFTLFPSEFAVLINVMPIILRAMSN